MKNELSHRMRFLGHTPRLRYLISKVFCALIFIYLSEAPLIPILCVEAGPVSNCGVNQIFGVNGLIMMPDNGWHAAGGCKILSSATEVAEDQKFGLLFGLRNDTNTHTNVSFYKTSLTDVQLLFQFPLPIYAGTAKLQLTVDSCTFKVNALIWTFLIIFGRPPTEGSIITFTNNTFDISTVVAPSVFTIITFYTAPLFNITLVVQHSRILIHCRLIVSTGYIAIVSFGYFIDSEAGRLITQARNTSLLYNSNIVEIYADVYTPSSDVLVLHAVALAFPVPLFLKDTARIVASKNTLRVFSYNLLCYQSFILFQNPAMFEGNSIFQLTQNDIEGFNPTITSVVSFQSAPIFSNYSNMIIDSCKCYTTYSEKKLSMIAIRAAILNFQYPFNTSGSPTIRLVNNSVSIIIVQGFSENGYQVFINVAVWFATLSAGTVSLDGALIEIDSNEVSVMGLLPDGDASASDISVVYLNAIEALVIKNQTLICLRNNLVKIDTINMKGHGQSITSNTFFLDGPCEVQGPHAGFLVQNETHRLNASGFSAMESKIITMGLITLKGSFLNVSDSTIDIFARTPDGRGPYDPSRLCSAHVHMFGITSGGLDIENGASLFIQRIIFNRNSSYNKNSAISLFWSAYSAVTIAYNSIMQISDNVIQIYAGGETAAASVDSISIMYIFVTDFTISDSGVILAQNNDIVVDRISPQTFAEAAVPLQPIGFFGFALASGLRPYGRLFMSTNGNVTFYHNRLRSNATTQFYGIIGLECLNVSHDGTSSFSLVDNLFFSNLQSNIVDTPLVSAHLATTSPLLSSSAFIFLCRNYRDGYIDETVSPMNVSGNWFYPVERGPQCNTQSPTASFTVLSGTVPTMSMSHGVSMSNSATDVSSSRSLSSTHSFTSLSDGSLSHSFTLSLSRTLSQSVSYPSISSSASLSSVHSISTSRHRTLTFSLTNSISASRTTQTPITSSLTFTPIASNSPSTTFSPTESLTVPIPIPPDQPIKDAREESEKVAGPILGIGGILAPQSGGQASIAMAALRLSERCNSDQQEPEDSEAVGEPLSPFVHPLAFEVGSGPYRYFMGAVIGNCLIIPIGAASLFRVVLPVLLRRWVVPDSTPKEALIFIGWPYSMVLIAPPLAEGTTASVANLLVSARAAETLLGIFGAVLIASLLVAWFMALWMRVHRLRPLLAKAPFMGWIRWPLVPLFERVSKARNAEETLQLCAPLYGDGLWLWAGCAGYGCGIVVGVIEGIGHRLPCGAAFPLLLVFAIVQSVMACTTLVPAELVVEFLVGACLILLCSSATMAVLSGESFLTVEEENAIGLMINILSLFGVFLGMLIVAVETIHRRAVILFKKSARFGQGLSFRAARTRMLAQGTDGLDDDDDTLLSAPFDSPPLDLMNLFLESIHHEVNDQQKAKSHNNNNHRNNSSLSPSHSTLHLLKDDIEMDNL